MSEAERLHCLRHSPTLFPSRRRMEASRGDSSSLQLSRGGRRTVPMDRGGARSFETSGFAHNNEVTSMRSPGLSLSQLNHYARDLGTMARVLAAVLVTMFVLAMFAKPANAQTEPSVTFGASVTNAAGSLSTRVTWSTTPAATSCTAAGHPSWTGTKAASGTADLPAITMSGTYTLTLACSFPADSAARLSWTAPVTNTDGTALAKCASQTATGPCLRSFSVHRGTSPTALTTPVIVDDRNATSYTVTNLPAGTHYFAVRARNGDGTESALSDVGSKVIGSSQAANASVRLTVNPLPNTVTDLEVQ